MPVRSHALADAAGTSAARTGRTCPPGRESVSRISSISASSFGARMRREGREELRALVVDAVHRAHAAAARHVALDAALAAPGARGRPHADEALGQEALLRVGDVEVVRRLISVISIFSGLESLRGQSSQHGLVRGRGPRPLGAACPSGWPSTAPMMSSGGGAQPGR